MKIIYFYSILFIHIGFRLVAQNQVESIVRYSNNRETTHHLKSGVDGFQIGITSNAGGVLNEIIIPGIHPDKDSLDIMDRYSDPYGRSAQSSMRDLAHRGKFNPTQAGFNESLGAPCNILGANGNSLPDGATVGNKLVVSPFQMSLWKADGDYDFTEFEGPITNLPKTGDRLYGDDYLSIDRKAPDFSTATVGDEVTIPGDFDTKDNDNLDEDASITHKDEIGSPFHYAGTYENYKGKSAGGLQIAIPVIRHYYEYRFDIVPNHSMDQFVSGYIRKNAGQRDDPDYAGQLVLNPSQFLNVTLPNNPAILSSSPYKTTYQDMSHLTNPWSIRMDLSKWSPRYRHVLNKGTWLTEDRTAREILTDTRAPAFNELFMVSDDPSSNGTTGKSLGFYRPKNDVNVFSIIGRFQDGTAIPNYEYDRSEPAEPVFINESFTRTGDISWIGFIHKITAMLNTKALRNGRYETYRAEYFMFYGTPKEIREAVTALDTYLETTMVETDAASIGTRVPKTITNTDLESITNREALFVFPNPSNDGIFNISSVANWKIYSVLGNEIKSGNGNKINLSEEPKGVYLLKMNDTMQRIILE